MKMSLFHKNAVKTFWATFEKIGLLFTPSSGHTRPYSDVMIACRRSQHLGCMMKGSLTKSGDSVSALS